MALNLTTTTGNQDFSSAMNTLAGWANAIAAEANSFLDTLRDLEAIDFSQVGGLPEFKSIVWLGSTAGTLDKPVRPTLSLGNIETLITQLGALQPPLAPTVTFDYVDPGYSSQLRQPMIEKLLSDVINGGFGIDVNDEIALFNRARDREAMLTAAAVEEVKRQAAATSFPLPQGAMFAQLQRARQDEMAKNSSVNRDIALKRADLFVENRRRVIDQILQTEAQEMALYNAIQSRTIIAAQTKVQLAIALFDAGIRLFQSSIEGLKSQIEGTLENARAQVQIYASDVSAYAAFVNAVVSGAQIDIANSQNVLRRDIAAHQSKVDIVKFRLQQLITTVENSRNIAQYGTEFFRTGLGSAINGVNGLAVQSGEVV